MKKFASLILVMLILLSMLCGCEFPVDSTTSSSKNTEIKTISIPGTFTAENFTFTIVSAEIVDSVTLDSVSNVSIDADAGKQFLVLCVDAVNTSSEIRNLGAFTTYVDNTTVLPHNVLGKYNDRTLMSGAVHPGKTMNTYVMYQVPTDWETFEISYMDTLTCSISESVKFSRSDVK